MSTARSRRSSRRSRSLRSRARWTRLDLRRLGFESARCTYGGSAPRIAVPRLRSSFYRELTVRSTGQPHGNITCRCSCRCLVSQRFRICFSHVWRGKPAETSSFIVVRPAEDADECHASASRYAYWTRGCSNGLNSKGRNMIMWILNHFLLRARAFKLEITFRKRP